MCEDIGREEERRTVAAVGAKTEQCVLLYGDWYFDAFINYFT